jgi:tetratricopeptide (TPR) repeat protein
MRAIVVVLVGGLLGLAGCAKQVMAPVRVEPSVVEPAAPTPELPSKAFTLAHTVREGETLARIADLYYADPSRAKALAAANGLSDPDHLAPGSVIALSFGPAEWDDARRRAAALEPYNRGVDAMAAGDFDRAQREFQFSLQTAPELTDAQYNLALVLMKRGQHQEAERTLTALVAQRPQDADIGFALGNCLFYQTRYDEAAAAFHRVLSSHPGHLRAAFGEALSLHEAGRRAEATAAWRAYLALDGDSSWADAARRYLGELQGGGH